MVIQRESKTLLAAAASWAKYRVHGSSGSRLQQEWGVHHTTRTSAPIVSGLIPLWVDVSFYKQSRMFKTGEMENGSTNACCHALARDSAGRVGPKIINAPAGIPMNARSITIALLLVATLAATGGWYRAHQSLQSSRAQFVASTLEPMAALLKENDGMITELQAEPFVEKDNGILESYLVKIRRDGVAKNAPMKQRLDQLAENNAALVTLIAVYAPHARTAAFMPVANKFRNYAVAWRDRWNSVMELFMAGGSYPAAGPAFPKEIVAAVQTEIAATR
jgi:hypothetical protein